MARYTLAGVRTQALVEMSELSTAQQMVDYYKNMPARIRGHPIHVQFSMHDRLKVCCCCWLHRHRRTCVRLFLDEFFL